jgi:hypothetical protein
MNDGEGLTKYRIYKVENGYDVYRLKNEGNGWSKTFHSHYATREAAELAVQRLQEESR